MTLNMKIPVIWDETPWRYAELHPLSVERTACAYRVQKKKVLHRLKLSVVKLNEVKISLSVP